LGNSAEITTVSIVHGRVLHNQDDEERLALQSQGGEGGTSEDQVHSDLWEAVCLEFIARQEGVYNFIHDRIHEAAYSLIGEHSRAETHLRIGRLLWAHFTPERGKKPSSKSSTS